MLGIGDGPFFEGVDNQARFTHVSYSISLLPQLPEDIAYNSFPSLPNFVSFFSLFLSFHLLTSSSSFFFPLFLLLPPPLQPPTPNT